MRDNDSDAYALHGYYTEAWMQEMQRFRDSPDRANLVTGTFEAVAVSHADSEGLEELSSG